MGYSGTRDELERKQKFVCEKHGRVDSMLGSFF